MKTNAFLEGWRNGFGLRPAVVADRAGLTEARLNQIESGAQEPSVDELESLARALGLRADDLLEDDIPAGAGPDSLRLLMKSAELFNPSQPARLQMLAAARAALDLTELRDELGVAPPELKQFGPKAPARRGNQPVHVDGAELARSCRAALALKGPLSSVRDLLTQTLRIPIVAADLTPSGPEAFSVYAPGKRVAIVLNMVGKNENKLVARFTLLHELAHVLFDRPAQGSMGIACRESRDRTVELEVRANAFAMRMLLPERELRKHLKVVFTGRVFRGLMEEWGVHRTALGLYAGKLSGIGDGEAEKSIPSVDTTAPLEIRGAEELAAEREGRWPIPLERRGELLGLVIEGLRSGRLGMGRAAELLRVDATVDLAEIARALDLPLAD